MELYDISIPIRPSLAVWPGDTPYALTWNMRIVAGDSVNLGTVTMSTHTGTHADAPAHFSEGGVTVGDCDLERYLGPAIVIDLSGSTRISVTDVCSTDLTGTPRVLFKTLGWTNHDTFPAQVPVMDEDVPGYLQSQGVILIGVDVPSVDSIESKSLPNHHHLAACGIGILEALDLRHVAAGTYELVALPLKFVGADGSPVRAVLRRNQS